MSLRCTELVWRSTVRPPMRWLLLAIADRSDKYGVCWPSLTDLAARLHWHRRTVVKRLAEAEAAGFLRREQRRGTSTRYYLNLELLKATATSGDGGTSSTASTRGHLGATSGDGGTPLVVTGAHVTVTERSYIEQGKEFAVCGNCGRFRLVAERRDGTPLCYPCRDLSRKGEAA